MVDFSSIDHLTEFLNKSQDPDWIEFCKTDLDAYHKIQFEAPLEAILFSEKLLKELDSLINLDVDKKQTFELIRFDILFCSKLIERCRESLDYLTEKKFFKQKRIKSFQKKFCQIENILLEYTRKYAKVGVVCQT